MPPHAPAALPSLPVAALGYALLSALLFAGLDLSQKWSARYAVPTPASFLTLRLLSAAALSPLLLLLPGALAGKSFAGWPFVGLVLCNLLGNILYLISVYRADISVLGSLWPLKTAFLPLLLLLLPPHRGFPPLAYFLVVASVVGAILVAWNGKLRFAALREPPVLLMVSVTVPVFALSDYFLSLCIGPMGSPLTTCLTAWTVALIAVPPLLSHTPTRRAISQSLRGSRNETDGKKAVVGTLLTGAFLVAGVACIGQAFGIAYQTSGPSGAVWVNVFAMTSGVALLAVNVARPGWLEGERRGTYGVRFVGAVLLIASASWLFSLKPA